VPALERAAPSVRAPSLAAPAAAGPQDAEADGLDAGTLEVDVGPMEVHLRRASGARRIAAWAIDGIPFLALYALALRAALDRLPHGPLDLAGALDLAAAEARGITLPLLAGAVILLAVYHALSHGLAGATLGKQLAGIRVVGPDGRRPGLGRSAWRAAAIAFSLGLLGLGVLLALFTRSGRALHDLLARTWVVEAP
jgi:resuscitation-promoting factor RpfA